MKIDKDHGITFSPSAQTYKNTKLVLQCGSCLKWRCVYKKTTLKKEHRVEVIADLEILSYSCGTSLSTIEKDKCSIM